jgi:hypothetical protein
MSDANTPLMELTPLKTWHLHYLKSDGHVFPTFGSMQWFIRTHRDVLIEQGCLLPGRGGRHSLLTSKFEGVVMSLLMNEAQNILRGDDPHTQDTDDCIR